MWASQHKTSQAPKRIVSLVPSQTELLYHLQLETETIGITKFCVHPPHWLLEKTRVGGTKNINIDIIKSLKPDLIIANKEENIKADVMHLANDFPVWVTDVKNLDDAKNMILDIGSLTHKTVESRKIWDDIQHLSDHRTPLQQCVKKAIYLIWKDPYMTVGGDTYINEMMKLAGIDNLYKDSLRYPAISDLQEAAEQADLILLSSEPYPFKENHVEELKKIFPNKEIMIVDGEMFSWYGSRLLESIPYLKAMRADLYHIQP